MIQPNSIFIRISGGKSFDVGSEGKFFCNRLVMIFSKSNGTAKASVNGNGIANKIFESILI
jgi:hypothetical protein